MNGGATNSRPTTQNQAMVRYVHEIPYNKKRTLCNILDMDDCWKELGGEHMKLDRPELDKIGKAVLRKESPTDELLSKMESLNHLVTDLFIWLYYMKHFQAMIILENFVDPKYRRLIPESVNQVSELEAQNQSNISNATLVNQNNKDNVKKNNPNRSTENSKHGNERTTERKLSEGSDVEKLDPCIPYISFEELEKATNFWDPNRKLGRGGFGVVYRGFWKQTDIAIKRLDPQKKNEESNMPGVQLQQSLKELKNMNVSRHDNILPLYGYSIHDHKYVLVYQYMPHGSLEDCLHRPSSEYMPWYKKHKIAKGTARGLQFLHGMDPPLIHGDIKSANILLDQYFEPRIGDFGLAREGPKAQYTHVNVSRVYGTKPYLPDEFLRSKRFSKKVDTYSFGVVLFEIATGQRPFEDGRSKKYLRDFVYEYDINQIYNLLESRGLYEHHRFAHIFKLFINLGKDCVEYLARNRPDMIDVFKQIDSFIIETPFIPITPSATRDHRSPSPTNIPSRIPSPVFLQRMVAPEVPSFDKVPSAVNGKIESNVPVPQQPLNLPTIPGIRLTPPNDSKVEKNSIVASSAVSDRISESDTSSESGISDDQTQSEQHNTEPAYVKNAEEEESCSHLPDIPELQEFRGER